MPEQIKAFANILDALETTGILSNVVLIGGWAQYLYRQYFDDPVELSALRTVDVDILFKRPPAIKVLKPLTETLEELGFNRLSGPDGSTKFVSREMEIDFLIPDRGRGDEIPYSIPELSIFVQSLRLLDMLAIDTINMRYNGHSVRIPDPCNFCFHKLLVSERRLSDAKREKDLQTALEMARLLTRLPEWRERLPIRYSVFPVRQKVRILKILENNESPAFPILRKGDSIV